MKRRAEEILGAIDVGTNAIRLEVARPLADGSLETLHQERDPVRPGEGVFLTGSISPAVADRVVTTLRRYAALCRRHGARVRAVATSAIREARNGPAVVERVRDEAGLELEVVSGREEARLICLGVLRGKPETARSLLVDIGGGSTEIATAVGEKPRDLLSVAIGAVRLTELFGSRGRVSRSRLRLMRSFADEAFRESLPRRLPHPRSALGSSGTIGAVVSFAAESGERRVTLRRLERAVDELAGMRIEERRKRFEPRRAEIVVAGAVILEAAMRHLRLRSVTAVETGLRNGILVDLLLSGGGVADDHSSADAALAFGRRFGPGFDERHAVQVARLAMTLFDELPSLHGLGPPARKLLEAAALLHDVGNAVSYQKHHKHTYYLVANADIPGFANRERELVALIARYHRRSLPDRHRQDLQALTLSELRTLRKLAALLRLADALDRSHHQPVRSLAASTAGRAVRVRLRSRQPLDLEIWDAEREATLFRRVYGRRLEILGPR